MKNKMNNNKVKTISLDQAIMQLENLLNENQLNENLLCQKQLMEYQQRALQHNSDCGNFQFGPAGFSFPSPGRPSQQTTDFFWGVLGVGLGAGALAMGIGIAIGWAREK